jgi:hypothetical protein
MPAFVTAATERIPNFKGLKFTSNDLGEGAQVLRNLKQGQEMFLGADSVSNPLLISLLMPHYWGTGLSNGLHKKRIRHNLPRGPSADWWVLTSTDAAGTTGLTCLRKHGRARDNKFLVIR